MSVTVYAVGKIVGCAGLKGHVKLRPETHDIERLKSLHSVYIGATAVEPKKDVVEEVIIRTSGVVLKIRSAQDRTSAEKLVGQFLFVDEQQVASLHEGSYFTHEIIGCEVWSTDEVRIGIIEDVYKMPGQDLWSVRSESAAHLIPAVREFIHEVDVKRRRIVVKLIDGLLEQ